MNPISYPCLNNDRLTIQYILYDDKTKYFEE